MDSWKGKIHTFSQLISITVMRRQIARKVVYCWVSKNHGKNVINSFATGNYSVDLTSRRRVKEKLISITIERKTLNNSCMILYLYIFSTLTK